MPDVRPVDMPYAAADMIGRTADYFDIPPEKPINRPSAREQSPAVAQLLDELQRRAQERTGKSLVLNGPVIEVSQTIGFDRPTYRNIATLALSESQETIDGRYLSYGVRGDGNIFPLELDSVGGGLATQDLATRSVPDVDGQIHLLDPNLEATAKLTGNDVYLPDHSRINTHPHLTLFPDVLEKSLKEEVARYPR